MIFPKGLVHDFAQKRAFFYTAISAYICEENVFYDVPERKNAFLGYKNKKLKNSKKCDFSKGVSR